MALSIGDVQIGAQVEEMFDDNPSRYGKPLLRRRRGVIVEFTCQSGEKYNDGSGIKEIFVLFEKDKAPEKVANARLALRRPYDAAAAYRIRQDQVNAQDDELVNTHKLAVDKTGVDPNERLSEHNIEKVTGKKK